MINPLWWIYSLVFYVGVWIGILQEGGVDESALLLQCFVPVNIAYDVITPSDGTDGSLSPIIFIHGTCSTKERWYDIPQNVANRTHRIVYNIDASNHGDSDYDDCFNYDVIAADIVHFMEEQGIAKAILIGYGMGGTAAIKVALWNPEKVEMLIVENARVSRISDKELQGMVENINLFEKIAGEIPVAFNYSEAYKYIDEKLNGSAERTDLTGTSVREGSQTAIITLTRKPDGHYTLKCNVELITNTLKSTYTTMSDNFEIYSDPALFIYGTENPYRPDSDIDVIKEHFPCAELEAIEGANRNLHGIYPDEFADAVVQFINFHGGGYHYSNTAKHINHETLIICVFVLSILLF